MKKIFTGRIILLKEFNDSNFCIACGKIEKIENNSYCNVCNNESKNKCSVCEIVLRKDKIFYYYNTTKNIDVKLHVNNKPIREYKYKMKQVYKIYSDDLCVDCVNWKDKISNTCWLCKNNILPYNNVHTKRNLEESYKLNGNMCDDCINKLEVRHYNTQKT